MNKLKHKAHFGLILILLLFAKVCHSQTKKIFNDTTFASPNKLEIGNMSYWVIDFAYNLPTGKYKYYVNHQKKIDSTTKNVESYLEFEGEFKDSLRHGTFKYYGNKGAGELYIIVNYSEGKLNGQYISFYSNGQKIEEGNFSNGKMHGFFILYDHWNKDGTIKEIKLYNMGKLISKAEYKVDGTIVEEELEIPDVK